jgi:hypothetical protein
MTLVVLKWHGLPLGATNARSGLERVALPS